MSAVRSPAFFARASHAYRGLARWIADLLWPPIPGQQRPERGSELMAVYVLLPALLALLVALAVVALIR